MNNLFPFAIAFILAFVSPALAQNSLLPKQELLEKETFWDNKDWDWYKSNIPFFECPDSEIQTTYYYRWELLTKHLTYGSPNSGYSFTEFIDRPFWSGTYGAISCPAGHQLYEARWLRNNRYSQDYCRYWLKTPGAQPRNYSTWLADSVWATYQIHPNLAFINNLLSSLKTNHEGWEKRFFSPQIGLFWQNGHDDGMEFNINSRQSKDILRGAPAFRPTINSYMYADAIAIAKIAELANDKNTSALFRSKAESIKDNLQKQLWDPKRKFFFPLSQREEEADGFKTNALTLTYQTGKYAGSEYGRELIGYIPWQFNLPDANKGYEVAWKKLLDSEGFKSPFGPSTVERNDPMFLLKKSCCWWSGQSWPYATSQTLKAMANLLQNYPQSIVNSSDYFELFKTFAKTHRKNGSPYLAEACNPDTGSFEGHDAYNHSEHYFHSSFNDLLITGLIGIIPRDDNTLEIKPLAPPSWHYFALSDIPYKDHLINVIWDRDGSRYKKGKGLRLFANGIEIANSANLGPLSAKLPLLEKNAIKSNLAQINYAVNNDGDYYPRLDSSFVNPKTPISKLIDGNYWYHISPPNRWTCEGSPNQTDWVSIDLGSKRKVHSVKLYVLDDGKNVTPPSKLTLEHWTNDAWAILPNQTLSTGKPMGRMANTITFPEMELTKIRITMHQSENAKAGLSEIEIWGDALLPISQPINPPGNIAFNPGNLPFPKASASYEDRFGGKPASAIDGKTNFLPSPTNRWTCYESPNSSDWLEVDFGAEKSFNKIELAIYDDRGGVQPPTKYDVQFWNGSEWKEVLSSKKVPEKPIGGQFNQITFNPVKASKVRVVFTHSGKARSGVSEILIWND